MFALCNVQLHTEMIYLLRIVISVGTIIVASFPQASDNSIKLCQQVSYCSGIILIRSVT